jgi:hypothetical protein
MPDGLRPRRVDGQKGSNADCESSHVSRLQLSILCAKVVLFHTKFLVLIRMNLHAKWEVPACRLLKHLSATLFRI